MVGQHAAALAHLLALYMKDNKGQLPPARSWENALKPYLAKHPEAMVVTKDLGDCHTIPGEPKRRFAMNVHLSGVKLSSVPQPDKVPLLFEKYDTRKNACGSPLTMAPPPPEGCAVVWASGMDLWLYAEQDKEWVIPEYGTPEQLKQRSHQIGIAIKPQGTPNR